MENPYLPVDQRYRIWVEHCQRVPFVDLTSSCARSSSSSNYDNDWRMPLVKDEYKLEYKGRKSRAVRDEYNEEYLMLQTLLRTNTPAARPPTLPPRHPHSAHSHPPQPHRPAAPPCPTLQSAFDGSRLQHSVPSDGHSRGPRQGLRCAAWIEEICFQPSNAPRQLREGAP